MRTGTLRPQPLEFSTLGMGAPFRFTCFFPGMTIACSGFRVQGLRGRAVSDSSRMVCLRLVQEGVRPVVITRFPICLFILGFPF